jgi:hypothetical protein
MPAVSVLSRLRGIVDNDAYAGTFQSFGQYRGALRQHIDNLMAGARAAGVKQPMEKIMNSENAMPTVASLYPSAHPFPEAVRRVGQLEHMLRSGVVVQLDALTAYAITANGGMKQDKQGPWVMKVDVMGHARNANEDTEALALFTGKMHERLAQARKAGRYGWDSASCSVDSLARLLILNVASGDHVSVANYAMMLEQRSADGGVMPEALAYFSRKLAAPPACTEDQAENFAQALIAQGWHNADPACVDGLKTLLSKFLATQLAPQ